MSDRDDDFSGPTKTRWSTAGDAPGLAEAHRAAWRYAYAGIIPGLTLERMLARRGLAWWTAMHDRGHRALVIGRGQAVAGYATLGRGRTGRASIGEIYELYVRPEYHGCGLGRRLFAAARRELGREGLDRVIVWALADNMIACRFYTAMGGAEYGRSEDRFCGVSLAKIGFSWA